MRRNRQSASNMDHVVSLSFSLLPFTIAFIHNRFATHMEHPEYPNLMGNGMNMPRGINNAQGSNTSYASRHTVSQPHRNPHLHDYQVWSIIPRPCRYA